MTPNCYDEPTTRTRRTRRMIVEYRLNVPVPADHPALPFEPAQPAQGELTIEARFMQFHRSNPHVYNLLRDLALAKAERGARRISPKLLFEELRAGGTPTATGEDTYQLNNIFTSRYARLLAVEPGLLGRIPTRSLKAE
jgi:hypothetical protein